MITRRAFMPTAVLAGAAAALGLADVDPALADDYPSRPIRIIVPFAAGGPLDLVGRLLADKMSPQLKQPIVIESRPGAGGNVGDEAVAKAPTDGYTLLLTLSTALTVNPWLYSGMTFDPQKDLRPISILTRESSLLVVPPSVPVNSVAEFVAMAKKQPVTYCHAGFGSPGHLAMEYFALQAGFHGVSVPYKGNAPAVAALLGGQVTAGFLSVTGVLPHVQAGRLKALAISSPMRSPLAPDVPTIAESGYPGFAVETDFILMAPAGLPDPIAAELERVARQAIQAPDVQAKIAAENGRVIGSTGAEARERIAQQSELWKGIVKAADMHAE
jgi:tripartite-type tricarboxylate transporter receptor subunit TctC